MKIKSKCFVFAGCFFGKLILLQAQGFIVPNGVTLTRNSPVVTSIHVLQNPTNSDFTGFFLYSEGANTFSFDPLLDEGVRTFLVSSNQPVSLSPILEQRYTELLFPNSYVFNSGSSFYLGFYTGYGPFDPNTGAYTGIYRDPLFGWALLVNNGGVIRLLDSALEYGGGGIYAGTRNILPVPEPSAIFLTALGALLLGIRRWRRD